MIQYHEFMPQSLSNFDEALKDDYGPGLRNSLNNSNVLFTELGRNTENIQGRQAVWSVHTTRSNSSSARAELAALGAAGNQGFISPRDALAYLYHTIKVSGQALHLTKGDSAAFARALETEIKGADKDLRLDYNRQGYGQAVSIGGTYYSGVIGVVSGGDTNTLIMATLTEAEMRYFFRGMLLDVVDPTSGVVQGTAKVTTIDVANRTVELDANTTAATSDLVVRSGNLGNEINGLRFLVSNANYAGITVSSVPEWASLTYGSSTTGISEVVLDRAAEKVVTDGDGQEPNLWITEHSQRAKVASQLQVQKRYDGREMTLKAGWKGLQIAYGVLLADRFCPSNLLFGINTSEMEQFIGLDFTWDDDDSSGRVLYKALDDSDAVQARFKSYRNLEATNRNSHIKVTLSVPTF